MKTINHLSISDFLSAFLVALHDAKADLPGPLQQKVWYTAFYRLHKESGEILPLVRDLTFEWDARNAACPDIREALQSMRDVGQIPVSLPAVQDQYHLKYIEFWRARHAALLARAKPCFDRGVEIFKEEYAEVNKPG